MRVVDTTTNEPVRDDEGKVINLPFVSAQRLASHKTRTRRLHVVETISFDDHNDAA